MEGAGQKSLEVRGCCILSLHYSLPLDFRKQTIDGLEAHKSLARTILDEVIGSVNSLQAIRKKRNDETMERFREDLTRMESRYKEK